MNPIVQHILLIAVSVPMLYFGAELLVSGSSGLARELRIRPSVIGLTIVAFATSGPELVVGIVATLRGVQDVTVGDVIGANVANIGLIIGASALLAPLAVSRITARREVPITVSAQIALFLFALSGTITRIEGAVLILMLVAFVVYMIRTAKDASNPRLATDPPRVPGQTVLLVVKTAFGIALLVSGGYFLVGSATFVAEKAGITNLTIGATMVAFLTTVPELATSLIAARRGEGEIAVGNAIGSVFFNSACVLGIAAVINPIAVGPSIAHVKIPIMIGLLFLLALMMAFRLRVSRRKGVILFACYLGFIAYTILTGAAD
ncbi:MAG: calcium/sodium antiporter [Verrucomicrobia bacterium]|nr:calcium/sodium antiporter [Verrucomicrobiota bacterium]